MDFICYIISETPAIKRPKPYLLEPRREVCVAFGQPAMAGNL